MAKQQIEHVVMLMLENRSIDNILGWLYENDTPQLNIPPLKPGERAYEGLQGLDLSTLVNQAGNLSSPPVRGASGLTIPSISPGETLEQVHTQLFNQAYDPKNPTSKTPPTMNGYLKDYISVLENANESAEDVTFYGKKIMESHTPIQLSVLNGLAKHYAVCDHWFSSIPSQTNPNRAFSLTGTSQGLTDNGYLEKDPRAEVIEKVVGIGIGDDRFEHKTVFNALEEVGMTDWQIFWETSLVPQKISNLLDLVGTDLEGCLDDIAKVASLTAEVIKDITFNAGGFVKELEGKINSLAKILKELEEAIPYMQELTSGELTSVYTYRLFPALKKQVKDIENHFTKVDKFHEQAKAGTLPKFSFIEPFWSISESSVDRGIKKLFTQLGNDYHPPCNQDVGEAYVKSIYESLISNESAWDKTLFIVTFDEQVGAYDHVPPPVAVPPWGVDGTPDFKPPIGFDGKPKPLLQHNFPFNRYGGRVPTLLISPYIQKGTVFRSTTDVPYDHTSHIASILKILGHEEKINDFGERVKQAPTFEGVVTLNKKRTDAADIPFMQQTRKMGEPVLFYDRFYLKNQNGKYLSGFKEEAKIAGIELPGKLAEFNYDLGVSAKFPTLSKDGKIALYLQKSEDRPNPGQINANDLVKLISTETGLNSDLVLGAWSDSHDCYYYDDYLQGENNAKQEWTIERENGSSGGINFGDKVYLVNKNHINQRLSHDNRLFESQWITTKTGGDYWTIEPITD